jgi:hypothetical protein
MELSHFGAMNDIDKQIVFKLFELSINRYSEVNEIFFFVLKILIEIFQVRRKSQSELFSILKCYRCSYQLIINRIVELLDSSSEADHDQIKVCLLSFFSFSLKFTNISSRVVYILFWVIILFSFPLIPHGK